MAAIPTIRESPKAKLLLYKLIRDKLKVNQKRILDEHPALREKVLNQLEGSLEAKGTSPDLTQMLEVIFFAIEAQTTKGLERQLKYLGAGGLIVRIKPSALLDVFVKEHLMLIKSVQREQLEKIGLGIQRGIREGLLKKDIGKYIRQATDLSKKRARRIARNAPLQYSGVLTRYHQTNNGIKKYRWQTSQDERVRDSHSARNNNPYSWDSSRPHPRSEVNCRCDAVPILK